jgi:hypothetical protein
MYSTLPEFLDDLKKVEDLLDAIYLLKDFANDQYNDSEFESPLTEKIAKVHESAKNNHANFVILSSIILLFLAGRFEFFVRSTFEESCLNCISEAEKFSHLPREMRDNLVKMTVEVISNPRKYGHGDLGVRSFAKILSDNLSDLDQLTVVNHSCLSITTENMRSQVLTDLFKRIGIKNIWTTIGQQAKLKIHFETSDDQETRKKAELFLNDFMDIRNKIAHPSSSFIWPDIEYVRNAVSYFKVLSNVLDESIQIHEIQIKKNIKEEVS